MHVCMYVCMYVYFNEWRSDRVMVRLGLKNTLRGWLYAVRMYVCMYVCRLHIRSSNTHTYIPLLRILWHSLERSLLARLRQRLAAACCPPDTYIHCMIQVRTLLKIEYIHLCIVQVN